MHAWKHTNPWPGPWSARCCLLEMAPVILYIIDYNCVFVSLLFLPTFWTPYALIGTARKNGKLKSEKGLTWRVFGHLLRFSSGIWLFLATHVHILCDEHGCVRWGWPIPVAKMRRQTWQTIWFWWKMMVRPGRKPNNLINGGVNKMDASKWRI